MVQINQDPFLCILLIVIINLLIESWQGKGKTRQTVPIDVISLGTVQVACWLFKKGKQFLLIQLLELEISEKTLLKLISDKSFRHKLADVVLLTENCLARRALLLCSGWSKDILGSMEIYG